MAKTKKTTAAAPISGDDYMKKHSQWGDVWRRLRRNKLAMFFMVILILLVLMAVLAGPIFGDAYKKLDPAHAFALPSWEHPFGTDNMGRDMLARIAYGARKSLLISLMAVIIATAVGTVLGTTAGFFGGLYENIVMRIMDIFMAIPGFLMAMTVATALGSGPVNTAIAIACGSIPAFARLTRASVLSVKDQQYVEAANAIGTNNFMIIFKHILPNIFGTLLVDCTMRIGGAINAIAGLSFVGLGVKPPDPEWGSLLTSGVDYIRQYPHLAIFPGLFIILAIFSFNLFGDGLRDAMDPRLKQ